jgi:hypothetical protein
MPNYIGVTKNDCVRIYVGKRGVKFGPFPSPEEAARIYDVMASRLAEYGPTPEPRYGPMLGPVQLNFPGEALRNDDFLRFYVTANSFIAIIEIRARWEERKHERRKRQSRAVATASKLHGFTRHGNKFAAAISACGKTFYLGLYDLPEQAARRYDQAAFYLRRYRAKADYNFPGEYYDGPDRRIREIIDYCEPRCGRNAKRRHDRR